MTLTDDIILPTDEELQQKDIPLTHNFFLTSAMWLGKYCDFQCKEFMLCRKEEGDPRKCIQEGKDVTNCGLEFFKKVKKTCKDEFEWYDKCLVYSGNEPIFRECRNEQALFDGCMFDSGFERANFGHFQQVRVHDSKRPRPKPHVPLFPDSVETFDLNEPGVRDKGPRGLGGRYSWEAWIR